MKNSLQHLTMFLLFIVIGQAFYLMFHWFLNYFTLYSNIGFCILFALLLMIVNRIERRINE